MIKSPDEEREDLVATLNLWIRSWERKDLEAITNLFVDDATLMNPRGDTTSGFGPIRTAIAGKLASPGFDTQFQVLEIDVASECELGTSNGFQETRLTDGTGRTLVERLYFQTFWKRLDAGWRIAIHGTFKPKADRSSVEAKRKP